jgi:AraC-like DNA-binding protein
MENQVFKEVTPLSATDCFMVFTRVKKEFTYPIHIHDEYELNFIENATGAMRVVGDSMEEIDDLDLTLITGVNLRHAWLNNLCKSDEIREITIQFHSDLLSEQLLSRNQFRSVKDMFEKAVYGVNFPRKTIEKIKPMLNSLSTKREGAHSVLKLFAILYDLSLSDNMRILSTSTFDEEYRTNFDSRRINKAYDYMMRHYEEQIRLSDVAQTVNMTDVAFSRFIKKRTGKNYIDVLNDIRIGKASRLLVDTTHSIAEICFNCGFNNLSNFNRIFRKKKNCTPKEFRENYLKNKVFF